MLGYLFFPYVSTFSLSSKGPQPLSRITAQSSICDHKNVQHEVSKQSSNNEIDNVETELIQDYSVVYESVQCTLLGRLSKEKYRTNQKAINYYTGFSDWTLPPYFLQFINCFLTLINLRQVVDDYELNLRFEISEKTVLKMLSCEYTYCTFGLRI